jgi:hypothetical protein
MAEQLVKDAMVLSLVGGKFTAQALVHQEGGVKLGAVVPVEDLPANFQVWFKEVNRQVRNEVAVPTPKEKVEEKESPKGRTVKDK